MKLGFVKFVKVGSLIASVCGMIGSAWAASKENEATLAKLVEKALSKNS